MKTHLFPIHFWYSENSHWQIGWDFCTWSLGPRIVRHYAGHWQLSFNLGPFEIWWSNL